ncbi:MAG: UDP-N-acetylmuramoyl-L-alanine--D-glutamate ligase [Sphingomonadales bacterium]|jgi:UDP-N-acetylmuramoylalanine--D-glutamate ligase|nr:UDP-N-acetylmuramoyl-L-alanine--D-glutamate ligase [Sphingomonadales bacterium]MBK9004050.1 UDP-N-acetylmuramoyl-L-alanine--D-glutamate ligase [Sphingomonadales bacterium]MBK9269225.1 UDP-N-acetylmuramoyl-L-alanine--D-glutamate ligase [Sphingomonadales bacterium]MBP6433759.1 UDP-N-acetylmuramoyl-L-alanine--D-glutamate ligase [Sphingorhabdus sp.]
MIVSEAFRGKRYAVLGLARSGLATVRSLVASGAAVTAWDAKEEARVQVEGEVSFADPMEIDLAGFDGLVLSPGVPLNTHPIANKARDANVPIIGDIELFALARASLPPHKVIGITGTNGKSTTTALLHHMMQVAGLPSLMGGNIGLPILSQQPLPEGGVYVLELSSYQIDLTHSLDCDVALLTNITPDHLDRYDSFLDYAASKERLFHMQHADKVSVIAVDDDPCRMIASRIHHRLRRVSARNVTDQSRWPSLQGPHNAQNVACAIAACEALGIDAETIERGLATYPGLAHRMERIGEIAGVLYVNDSKATNPTSTAPALGAYPAIHWLLGGQAKGNDLDACLPHLGNVVAAYAFGEDGAKLAGLLRGKVGVNEYPALRDAALAAAGVAQAGETVLLSPACASFDEFRDFEHRGDSFREIVAALRDRGT